MPSAYPQASSRYQPIAQIGRGTMAEVVLAQMRVGHDLTKVAVLKRIWPELATDADFVAMFLREARFGARMNHPNVIQTYEIIEDEERPAIAFEYVDGQPLSRVLNRLVGSGILSLALRLKILTNILAGLDYAHDLEDYDGGQLGVVHRDVNPQNVFVSYDGQVKLVDFGVAKSLADAYGTRPGSMRGKLGYLAPEQLQGRIVDRRADVFSVGVMLWEMVAGRRLWKGMTEGQIISHLTSGASVPRLPADPNLPSELAEVCARALESDPERRYPTAAAFEADISQLLPGTGDLPGRRLGKIVSFAFVEERAERQILIEQHRRRARESLEAEPVEEVSPEDIITSSPIRVARSTAGGLARLNIITSFPGADVGRRRPTVHRPNERSPIRQPRTGGRPAEPRARKATLPPPVPQPLEQALALALRSPSPGSVNRLRRIVVALGTGGLGVLAALLIVAVVVRIRTPILSAAQAAASATAAPRVTVVTPLPSPPAQGTPNARAPTLPSVPGPEPLSPPPGTLVCSTPLPPSATAKAVLVSPRPRRSAAGTRAAALAFDSNNDARFGGAESGSDVDARQDPVPVRQGHRSRRPSFDQANTPGTPSTFNDDTLEPSIDLSGNDLTSFPPRAPARQQGARPLDFADPFAP